tara:strand:- start:1254 stop:4001 length:2748 start_codon:yes stop_codon:yes gene_type:complete
MLSAILYAPLSSVLRPILQIEDIAQGGVLNQAIDFGDKTADGAGKYTLISTGDAITEATIASGDASGHWNIDTGGNLTPSTAGAAADLNLGPYTLACTYNSEADSATHTITIEANTYSTASVAETEAALDAAVATNDGATVKIRDGDYTATGTTFSGMNFTTEAFLTAHNERVGNIYYVSITAPAVGGTSFSGTDFLTVSHLDFHAHVDVASNSDKVIDYSFCTDVTWYRCRMAGKYLDPEGDYDGLYPGNCAAINYVNPNTPTNVTITECLIEQVSYLSEFSWSGNLIVTHNTIKHCNHEIMKLHQAGNGDAINGTATINYNRATDLLSHPNTAVPASSPHCDFVQIFQTLAGNWPNIEIIGNLYDRSSGGTNGTSGQQGVFHTASGSAAGYGLLDPRIIGNTFLLNNSPHAITLNAVTGGLILNNTCLRQDPDDGGLVPAITIDSIGGTTIVDGNIAEAYFFTDSGGTVVEVNNKTVSNSTSAYNVIVDGTTYGHLDRAALLAAYSMKANGPADNDNSGTGTKEDSGAIGSGIITFGNELSTAGWAYDVTYEDRTDVTPPVFASSTPADNATDVAVITNPTITFTESGTLSFGTSKTFTVYDVTNTVNEEVFSTATDIGSGPGKMSLAGNTVTLEMTSDLTLAVEYAVKWDAGAVKDDSNNEVAVNTTNTLVSFTTIAASYAQNVLHFDGVFGTNLLRTTAFNTVTDTKTWTASGWVDFDGAGTQYVMIVGRMQILRVGSTLRFQLQNAAGTIIYQRDHAVGSGAIGRTHFLWAGDLGNATDELYINDVTSASSTTTFTNDTIDFTLANNGVGARSSSFDRLLGSVADLMGHNGLLDITDSGVRARFIDGSGDPVDPGSDGSTAMGVQPVFALIGQNAATLEAGASGVGNVGYGGDVPKQASYVAGGITDSAF